MGARCHRNLQKWPLLTKVFSCLGKGVFFPQKHAIFYRRRASCGSLYVASACLYRPVPTGGVQLGADRHAPKTPPARPPPTRRDCGAWGRGRPARLPAPEEGTLPDEPPRAATGPRRCLAPCRHWDGHGPGTQEGCGRGGGPAPHSAHFRGPQTCRGAAPCSCRPLPLCPLPEPDPATPAHMGGWAGPCSSLACPLVLL